MLTSNIQLGVDLATALSVIGASFAYIREVQRNRQIEQLEKQKARSLRKNEFKLEKAAEVINTLSTKEYEMRDICERIDTCIRAVEDPEDINRFIVKLSDDDLTKIYLLGLENDCDHRFVPDNYRIGDLIKSLLKVLRETASYLNRNPYIEYLLDDQEINQRVSNIIKLNEFHGTLGNKSADNRKTLYMIVNDFENHLSALGGYIYGKSQSNRNIIKDGENFHRVSEELNNSTRNITNRERIKLLSRAYQDDFLALDNQDKKAKIYKGFVRHRIEAISRKRSIWQEIVNELNLTIKSLADYSYTTVSGSES